MGRKGWWVDWHGRSAPIVRASELRDDDRVNPRSRVLGPEVTRWLRNLATRAVMVDLYQSLVGAFDPLTLFGALGFGRSDASRQRVMRDRIVQGFRDGEIVLLRALEMPVPANAPEGDADDLMPVFDDTWVEVELVDPDGAPLANAQYRVVTPDGAVHEGTLDATGKMRVDGLAPPGACQIEFPGLAELKWGLRDGQ